MTGNKWIIDGGRPVEHGNRVSALGLSFVVDRILFLECLQGVYDIEFIDPRGEYHHWKQYFDGGQVERWNGRQWAPLNK